ncbi:HTH domain-containing protein [Bacillus licheniformis]|nr:HTH domain-containing protein [Bacillus licheniformis]
MRCRHRAFSPCSPKLQAQLLHLESARHPGPFLFGVTVKDVTIEHPVYGDLTASIRVSTRKEVADFVKKISSTNAAYLSQLTNGIHLHTLEADDEEKIVKRASVSRQVIVQDISLLKAKNEPIIATSQGYMYLRSALGKKQPVQRIIACDHEPEKTEEELNLIVGSSGFHSDAIRQANMLIGCWTFLKI